MRSVLIWMFVALILNLPTTAQDGPPTPTVVFPISGNFVYIPVISSESDLVVSHFVDTRTGDGLSLLLRDQVQSLILDPLWNMTGDQIAYSLGTKVIATQSLPDAHLYTVDRDPNLSEIYHPIGWASNSQSLFLEVIRPITSDYSYHLAKIDSGQMSPPLLTLTGGDSIGPLFALPDPLATANLISVQSASVNPVYQDWLLLFFYVIYLDASDNPTPQEISVIYNYVTHQSIFLNDVIHDLPILIADWGDDGQFIAVNGSQNSHVVVFDPSLTSIATLYQQAPTRRRTTGEQIEGLLGVQDLLLILRRTDTELIYEIGQMQAGELLTQDFLIFERTKDLSGLDFAWHLTADEDERHALSCMFDSAQPTRLAVGAAAQVNFTTGTPLRLRDAPDFGATEITQMPEGTAFDVIGGPACVNGDSYYRFWQIELADGTVGWAAEADNDDYFMEPED